MPAAPPPSPSDRGVTAGTGQNFSLARVSHTKTNHEAGEPRRHFKSDTWGWEEAPWVERVEKTLASMPKATCNLAQWWPLVTHSAVGDTGGFHISAAVESAAANAGLQVSIRKPALPALLAQACCPVVGLLDRTLGLH